MTIELQVPKSCPQCECDNIIQILYGLPDTEALELAKAEKVKLGGCDMSVNYPDWHCKNCRFEWYDITDKWKIDRIRILYKMYLDEKYNAPIREKLDSEESERKRKYWREILVKEKSAQQGDAPEPASPAR